MPGISIHIWLGERFSYAQTMDRSLTWLANFKKSKGQLAHGWRSCKNSTSVSSTVQERSMAMQISSPGDHAQCGRKSHGGDEDNSALPENALVAAERSSQDLSQLQLDHGPIGILLKAVESGVKVQKRSACCSCRSFRMDC